MCVKLDGSQMLTHNVLEVSLDVNAKYRRISEAPGPPPRLEENPSGVRIRTEFERDCECWTQFI